MTASPDRFLSIDEAAAQLGISREGVRTRLRRGQLAGERRGRTWVVLSIEPVTSGLTGQTGPDHIDREHHEAADAESELLQQLRSENVYLRAALEREQTASAELRRMLNLEQQSIAALTAPRELLPSEMPAAAPQEPEIAPVTVESVQTPAAAEKALKAAGVKGKKARRKVLDRILEAVRGIDRAR